MNYELRIRNLVLFLIILGIILPTHSIYSGSALSNAEVPSFSLALPNFWTQPKAQIITMSKNLGGFAQVSPEVKLPGTLEEIKDVGLKALGFIPELLKGIWDGFSGFCLKVWNFLKNVWDSYIYPFFYNLWQKTLGKEIKERTPVIKEEYKKEKEEMGEEGSALFFHLVPINGNSLKEEIKTELPGTLKSLWEKFKKLIK